MKFTDIFIRRPVMATVISLVILLLGLNSINKMELRQYPQIATGQITISTAYPGASADVIQGFITHPIQQSVAGAEGIDYITSSSTQGLSTITVYLKLNYDIHKALTDIMSKVDEVKNVLPPQSQAPVIQSSDVRNTAIMFISFYSDQMSLGQITDYVTRVVVPKVQTLNGVAQAQVFGFPYAMRIWLDPKKMAAYGVTASDVANALLQNNYLSAPGATRGSLVSMNIATTTDLQDPQGFANIVLRSQNGNLVRIKDVAQVELGSQVRDLAVNFSGIPSVFMAINPTPDANPLGIVKLVRQQITDIEPQLPPSMHVTVAYDATKFISASISEVIKTIVEAALIVIVVIFLFLGAVRPVIIPVITIPLSLIGVTFFMLILGYSLNLLTLLAMVLAIGLVVDDAIVVVENTHRHIEAGKTPFQAALLGAREIATPVIAMTITLAAVFTPIGFIGGLTGALFQEFAFTLAAAVILSGIIALTLSPMMCSKFLGTAEHETRLEHWLNEKFHQIKTGYQGWLHNALNWRPVTVVIAIMVLINVVAFYVMSPKELAPTEDQGFVFVQTTGPLDATHAYMTKYGQQVEDIFKDVKSKDAYALINGGGFGGGTNSLIAFLILKPWNERSVSQFTVANEIQQKLNQIAGLRGFAFNFPSLPGASGTPVEFVVSSTSSYADLYAVQEKLMDAARKSGMFYYVDSDLKFDNPQLSIDIDRNKAQQLGINMQDLGSSLSTFLGGGYLNFFNLQGYSYQVIPQVADQFRRNGAELMNYYVRTGSGAMIPLSTVAHLTHSVQPDQLNQFQQLNSATISAVPGVPLGKALDFLKNEAKQIFPTGYFVNYAGESRQFVESGNALLLAILLALIVIFLVLAAQFESWRDPLVILCSVPLAFCGALIPIFLGAATVNIYTQVGLLTLIGLITKHGILMVDFANKWQRETGCGKREAIEHAAAVRLRPILMTTAAMVLGVVPLLVATGAGAVSRFDIGLVIACGMTLGTCFTLFVVPTMYTFFAREHHPDAEHAA
ncbi:MAG TPA: efflux RND transporter permease subunit [Gammaproteobacteria bacterium]|nr:efflux RND transporter permease subunit [Gammaproteobacteria bacterium]